jgi:hypothetical protein
MGEAVASQVLALELEKVRPNLSLMYQQGRYALERV